MNMKGGVGKTTLAVNVAYCLAKSHRKRTLLVDVDPQMNATEHCMSDVELADLLTGNRLSSIFEDLEARRGRIKIAVDSLMQGKKVTAAVASIRHVSDDLWLLPSHLRLWELDLRDHQDALAKLLDDVGDEYEYVIIDAPPTLSPYTLAALLAADHYVVPMKLDTLSVWGLEFFDSWIKTVNPPKGREVATRLGIIANMVHGERVAERAARERLRQRGFDKDLFKAEFSHRAEVQNALADTSNPDMSRRFLLNRGDATVAAQVTALTRELLKRSNTGAQ